MEKKSGTFCPRALKKLNKSIATASNANVTWNGATKYLVKMSTDGHEIVVDLDQRMDNPENYIHDCYKISTFLEVYSHLLEPLNGEEFWEETNHNVILPPLIKNQPGRPKKKRDATKDVVQTREGNPTMLKRQGPSLKCSYCSEWGHNARTCKTKKFDAVRKGHEETMPEEGGDAPQERQQKNKKPMSCSHCKQVGHTKRSCLSRKMNEYKQKEDAPPTTQRTPAEIEARREEALKKQQEKAMERHQLPTDQLPNDQSQVRNENLTHGGTLKPFKPPAQSGFKGIAKEKWKSSSGQEFTSLKKLKEAGQKMASKKNA